MGNHRSLHTIFTSPASSVNAPLLEPWQMTRQQFSEAPETVFHATQAEDFAVFDPATIGSSTDQGLLGAGFYFSTDPQIQGQDPTLIPARVQLDHPLVLDFPQWGTNKTALANAAIGTDGLQSHALTDAIRARGYDGVILRYAPVGYQHQEVVAFSPQQVTTHRQSVEEAIAQGYPVPVAVRQEYAGET